MTLIATLQLRLAMAALMGMGAVTVADVVLKYFGHPIAGAYDVVESLLPVVIFHGLPATLLRRQNIAIDLVDGVAGPRGTAWLKRIADVIMLGLLALLTWAMVSPARQAFEFEDRKLELGMPLYAIWAAVLLGMLGSVAVALTLVLRPARA